MPSYTNAWGDSPNSHDAVLHQGPARQAMVSQYTHYPHASTAQFGGASNGLQRSTHRPNRETRNSRRRRDQTGLTRGSQSPSESARDRAIDRLYPEIQFAAQADLTCVEFYRQRVSPIVARQTANDVAEPHTPTSRVVGSESEVPVFHNQLSHIEAPQPKNPVSPLILPEIPHVKVPDRGLRGTLRRMSPFSERAYLKSGRPRRISWGEPDLLYVGKYPDPRPRTFRPAPESSSPPGEVDDNQSEAASEESQTPLSPIERELADFYFASTHDLHGWYPGKKVYAPAEVDTEEYRLRPDAKAAEERHARYEAKFDTAGKRARQKAKARALDAALRTMFP